MGCSASDETTLGSSDDGLHRASTPPKPALRAPVKNQGHGAGHGHGHPGHGHGHGHGPGPGN
ncbi:MAG TPA: hypothetical protein VEQ59_07785, partial [Polyangiaceae bacterium]|nr:hypothetical protein [Polyangiaceae bacterium]